MNGIIHHPGGSVVEGPPKLWEVMVLYPSSFILWISFVICETPSINNWIENWNDPFQENVEVYSERAHINGNLFNIHLNLTKKTNYAVKYGSDSHYSELIQELTSWFWMGTWMWWVPNIWFHAAILQSGSELAEFSINWPSVQPENFLLDIALQFGCTTENSTEMVECLRGVSARRLINAEFTCPVNTSVA